jgi:type IV pilus assembly protein PilC
MPYFAWRGVDIVGTWKSGKRFAKSSDHLDALLFKRGIALLKVKPMRVSWFARTVSMDDKAQFFRQLSVLVDSGVLINQALELAADQVESSRLQSIVYMLAHEVHEGVSLSIALQAWPDTFDRMTIAQIQVGEESGNLIAALDGLAHHYERAAEFQKKMRAALLVPTLTLLFFLAVVSFIFIAIIPRFADLFTSYNQNIPPLTQAMLGISLFFQSRQALLLLGTCISGILLAYWWAHSMRGKPIWDQLILRIPLVGTFIHDTFMGDFFQSLAMLLAGGLRLVPAMHLIARGTDNTVCKQRVLDLERIVQEGGSLSQALVCQPGDFFSPESIALVIVGQESGRLVPMLSRLSHLYHQRLLGRLNLYIALVQPVCMILLGLLVTALVFAVYGPIFNIANLVNV